jgi:glycosyltransferase involved in cell wall biosynthesis
MSAGESAANRYEFSIIIPTHGRPQQLQRALAAISQTNCPRNTFEVIVVADGEGQGVEAVVAGVKSPIAMRVIEQPQAGPGSARNAGAACAQGLYLAFTDDDCLPTPGWLPALKKTLDASPKALIGGRTTNALEQNCYAVASQVIHDIVYSHYNRDPDQATFFASNNVALGADEFASLGGFDESFRLAAAEDRELCDRWSWAGRPMHYAPDAVVRHAHELTLTSFCRQHFGYGSGAARFHQTRINRGSGKFSDHLSFHSNLNNWLTPKVGGGLLRQIQIRALLFAWQVANALGFFWGMLRQDLGSERRDS